MMLNGLLGAHIVQRATRLVRPGPCNRRALHISRSEMQEGSDAVLFFSSVWPEPSSSAAGVRTSGLIDSFQQRGFRVAYASSSASNQHTATFQSAGVRTFECPPNNESIAAAVIDAVRPSIVVFDRYYAEEMWSFRVRDLAPEALRVLDMQDVHFFREARQTAALAGRSIPDIMNIRPDAHTPSCLRELASIYRSDLTLVCSPEELEILTNEYGVAQHRLCVAPFFVSAIEDPSSTTPSFADRRNFFMIGNFRHPPNMDSVLWAINEIWPAVRQQLADAGTIDDLPELHLYGSYSPQNSFKLHKPGDGIFLKGFAPSLDIIMAKYRVCLAPLRFGAGLKGKIVDSWAHGLPVCTTPIGAEGMVSGDDPASWGGLYGATTVTEFARDAVELYMNLGLWERCRAQGFELLKILYDRDERLDVVHSAINEARIRLKERRAKDYLGNMLWLQQLRSTEYFSRWIELKEKSNINFKKS